MFGDVCCEHNSEEKGYNADYDWGGGIATAFSNSQSCLNLLNLVANFSAQGGVGGGPLCRNGRAILCNGIPTFNTTISSNQFTRRKTKKQRVGAWGAVGAGGRDYFGGIPDEILCEIFKFLPKANDRVRCASVSKRWLFLQSQMGRRGGGYLAGGEGFKEEVRGDLSRCLVGGKATDVRLAAIAVGVGARGGLGKLSIDGSFPHLPDKAVSDIGLSAIGTGCPGLRTLSLRNCPFVSDKGLSAIAKGCPLLEKVEFIRCNGASFTDSGIKALVKCCPLLSEFTLEHCLNIGNPALKSIAESCTGLLYTSIKSCPLITHEGLLALALNARKLKHLKLSGICVSDSSMLAIGCNLHSLMFFSLENMAKISEVGFGSLSDLLNLRRLSIRNCLGFNDNCMEMLQNCRGLKHVALCRCGNVSDKGFAMLSSSIEVLEIEACHISNRGLIATLTSPKSKLKKLKLTKCSDIMDGTLSLAGYSMDVVGVSLVKSVCISQCPNIGDRCLAAIGVLCQNVAELVLTGIANLTDVGVLAFLKCRKNNNQLVDVSLSGCARITDAAVSAIVARCGGCLTSLALDRCKLVTDTALGVIASHCSMLHDLDISQCNVTNEGIRKLTSSIGGYNLRSLNLSGCTQITPEIVMPLVNNKCRSLSALNLK